MWLGPLGRDRLFGEPHCQAATLAQGRIIFRPVRYPILLLRNVVTAIGIGLEWHGGHISGGLWMGVAPSHLGLLSQICRRIGLGESNRDQRPAKSRSPNGEWSSTLPGPRRSAQLIRATRWRGATLLHRAWGNANEARTKLRYAWHEFFKRFDVLLSPVAPSAAFPH